MPVKTCDFDCNANDLGYEVVPNQIEKRHERM